MNDPVRLRETNGAARALLSAGRLQVPRGARQRALAFTGVAAGVATTGTAAAAGATSLFKSVLVYVCLGTVGGGVASLAVSETVSRLSAKPADSAPPVAKKSASQPTKAATATTEPAIPVERTAVVEPPAVTPPPSSVVAAPTPAGADTRASAMASSRVAPPAALAQSSASKSPRAASLFDEQRMIESARAAVSRGDAQSALATLDGYEQAYAQGQFGPEALALRIEALRARGDLARARSLAAEFQRRYPHHPLLPSLQAAVQSASAARH